MRVIGVATVLYLAALTALPAEAQVTAIVTSGGTTVNTLDGTVIRHGLNYASQIDGADATYGNYQASVALTPDNILYGNNVTAEGQRATVTSTTRLAVTFKNDGTSAVNPMLQSTIVPGGFGFYVAHPNPSSDGRGNSAPSTDINGAPGTLVPLNSFGTSGQQIAGATFSFTIKSGNTVIESLGGSVTATEVDPYIMHPDPSALINLTLSGDTGSVLSNFRLLTAEDDQSAVGYQWDESDLLLALPGGPLAPGDSRTLTYESTVTAFTVGVSSFGNCGGIYGCPTLQAYSGFGDPIGKGGTGGGNNAVGALVRGADDSSIGGLSFSRFSTLLPNFDSSTGMLTLSQSPTPIASLPLTPSVPEPGTWALLLLGVGSVGMALRRARSAASTPEGAAG